jgi:hypothetical protein
MISDERTLGGFTPLPEGFAMMSRYIFSTYKKTQKVESFRIVIETIISFENPLNII